MTSPQMLYSVEQSRALDALTIAQGTSGYTLMRRAGEAALRVLRSRWPRALQICVVTGGGNNGGDGYVVARFAQAAGLTVTVLAASAPEKLSGDARLACDEFRASGGRILPYTADALDGEVIVDALLGTGLNSPVRAELAAAIEQINASGRPVLSLDVPSGLNADTGAIMGAAISADCTISFVALKVGLFLGAGPELAGRLLFDDLGVSVPEESRFAPVLERLGEADVLRALPARVRDANKGDFGRVLLIGGGPGMPGALRLAGEACLRSGAGLVTAATWPDNLAAVVTGRPELIVHGVRDPGELEPLLQNATVLAVGPGLSRTPWARALLQRALAARQPMVLDADALNLMAELRLQAPAGSVLTPHPGEAGRLLGISAAEVQADRLGALGRLCRAHPGAVVVLKGAGTLIGRQAAGKGASVPGLCERGNPGMAAAGMGDVLTGAISGILAQCRDPWLAARAGVMAHALSGDELARERERGILALELAEGLSHWVNLKR